MMNLVPHDDEGAVQRAFFAIAASKERPRNERLARLRPALKRAFRAYLQHRNDLAKVLQSFVYVQRPTVQLREPYARRRRRSTKIGAYIRSILAHAREDLLHCYNSETKALMALLAAIDKQQPKNARGSCQYCCGAGRAETWDHYLPKELFPELAAFAPNLIPACFMCNGIKGTRWIAGGRRLLINFYYDRFDPGLQLVEATVNVPAGYDPEARFHRREVGHDAPAFEHLFARHWDLLHLEDRLREAAEGKFGIIYADIEGFVHWALDVRDIQEELVSKATRLAREYGANHYEVVLYRAAAASPAFVEYCLARARP